MNTNSKPLSTYDIIVAEVESVMGQSLHDLEEGLNTRYPDVAKYSPLPNLILNTSALLQGFLPNQRGAWDMDKKKMDVMTEDVAMRTAQVTKNPKINQDWVNHQWENVDF